MIQERCLPLGPNKVFIVIVYMSKTQQKKKLVAHIKDLTEEGLIEGLFTEELIKDGGAPQDKQQWGKKA